MGWNDSPLLERNAIREGLAAHAIEPQWAAMLRESGRRLLARCLALVLGPAGPPLARESLLAQPAQT